MFANLNVYASKLFSYYLAQWVLVRVVNKHWRVGVLAWASPAICSFKVWYLRWGEPKLKIILFAHKLIKLMCATSIWLKLRHKLKIDIKKTVWLKFYSSRVNDRYLIVYSCSNKGTSNFRMLSTTRNTHPSLVVNGIGFESHTLTCKKFF